MLGERESFCQRSVNTMNTCLIGSHSRSIPGERRTRDTLPSKQAVRLLSMVDNPVSSPNRLTLPLDLAYPSNYSSLYPHFKQRGSLCRNICFCSCSCPASYSTWHGFGTFTGSIIALPTREQWRCTLRFIVSSSHALHSIVQLVASPLLFRRAWNHCLRLYAPGVR